MTACGEQRQCPHLAGLRPTGSAIGEGVGACLDDLIPTAVAQLLEEAAPVVD